jgi:arsenate reductase (thioredoxin)
MTNDAEKVRVLFLCTANSARSQMAEAILRHEGGDRYEAVSAGTNPSTVNPLALKALEEAGISTAGLYSKGTREFLGKVRIQIAIIVCDKARASCPNVFPFTLQTLYWPFEDPAAFEGTEQEKLAKFREVRDLIRGQIQRWLISMSSFKNGPQ